MDDKLVFYVYEWYFKDTNEVFYVGKGKGKRFLTMQGRNNYFLNIVRKHNDNVAVRKTYENLTEEDAYHLERVIISEYRKKGLCKANFHEGGMGGHTGNYNNPERSKKLSEAAKLRVGDKNPMFGKTHTDEVKEYLRKINRGKKLSKEHVEKLRLANTKRPKTQAEIEKIRTKQLGKKITQETYGKMMDSLCDFEYQVYYQGECVAKILGHTELYRFCKEKFNISRTIVDLIKKEVWKPKFSKHQSLDSLKIKIINRRVSTNGDECNHVE